MIIKRDYYLNKLIKKQNSGRVKSTRNRYGNSNSSTIASA